MNAICLISSGKYSYWRYCQIRDCVNPRKCKRLTLNDVRERLQEEENLIFTKDILKISSKEVFFILDFIETYFELVS